jgi:hypothetical protein
MNEIYESKLKSGKRFDEIYADEKEASDLQQQFRLFPTQISRWFNDKHSNHKKKIIREQEKD